MPDRRGAHFLIPVIIALFWALLFPLLATGQTAVTLSPAASPASGQPGITVINLTGSGFPTGTIQASAVTVSLTPTAGGTAVATPSSAVTTIVGATRRVTFTIPASISVAAPTPYAVSISGTTTTNVAFASSNTASLTVNPAPQILSAAPATGNPGQTLSVTITGAYTTFVQGSTVATFGAGISVEGAAEGAPGPINVATATTAVAQLAIDAAASPGARNITVITGVQSATLTAGFTVASLSPTITSFAPQSGTFGTIVTINGTNFGTTPQVTVAKLGGGVLTVFPSSISATVVSFVVPAGATTGPLGIATTSGSATSTAAFTVTPSSGFTISAMPSSANLIQGQSVSIAATLASPNGFNQLAVLAVTGLPSGVTAAFNPQSITAGQTSVLTLTAPANQPIGSSNLTITASATVQGFPESQSAGAQLSVQGPTTSFLGRTVVSNAQETPLAGVTVTMLGLDGNGNTTGCTRSTVSDGAGNFALVNLPALCVGPQLIGYNGATVTSPAGKYAGVNIVYTLVLGQVTASPVLVHLPRIDNVETFYVTQNAAANQSYSYTSIPGLSVTVYAGTIFTLQDGTRPNPFPLAAVQVPVDRLPDLKPQVPTMIRAFIVAFQPANATTNEPVAVYFPNTLNTPPGTDMVLMTLDPTHGQMVPYGTGAVSADATQIVPDPDPAHPGHLYGLVHFDWHGPMPSPPTEVQKSPSGCVPCQTAGMPVDLASGVETLNVTDLAINGPLGSISIDRHYRTLTTLTGPFGIGTAHNYSVALDTAFPQLASVINLILPDGNRYPFSFQVCPPGPIGALCVPGIKNSTIPALLGAVMKVNSDNTVDLQWKDGTIYHFFPASFQLGSLLASITDPNGNSITITRNAADPLQITQVTDPVGRSFTLTYDGSDRITSITDDLGRDVQYTYNNQGTLATVTAPAATQGAAPGVTSYAYDSQNRLTAITDARGVVVAQNSYDPTSGRLIQQIQADGGMLKFSYVFMNPTAAELSPVINTVETDPNGNQTTYRFNAQGYMTDATDATGQTRFFVRAPGTNLTTSISGPGQCPICGSAAGGDLSFTYDGNGNLLTVTDALGNTTTLTYSQPFNRITSITDPLGDISAFTYDSHGNLLTTADPNGNTTTFAYNSAGQATQITDPLGNKTTLTYDGLGDVATVTDALGNTTAMSWDLISDALPVLTTDALGRRTGTTFDYLSRLIQYTDAKSNPTSFAYDLVGNLFSLTDAKGNATTYIYDAMDRPVALTNPLGESDFAVYDLNSNLTGFTDRRNQSSSYTYDSLNRIVKETYVDSTVTISYDANGRQVQIDDSASGDFAFAYDIAGRLTGSATPYGAVQYARDGLGRATSRQVGGQSEVAYTYDKAGNLLSASTAAASVSRTYDPRNLVATASRMNQVASQYSYDQLGRLSALTHTGPSGVLNSQAYAYDAVGNRVNTTNNIAQSLVTQAVTPALYNADNQQIQFGSTSNAFDANGSLSASANVAGTTAYTWDSRHRLTSVSAPNGQVTTFNYDFAGNLLQQKDVGPVANVTQTFVLDDLTNVAYVNRSDGDKYSVLTGQWIDDHMAVVHSSGLIEYALSDALSSTVATVDQTGAARGQFFYDPFGQTTASNSSYPFQYAGRTPVSSSLYYYRARYYSPTVGRFISEDPLGFGGGDASLYRYVGNSATNLVDPVGLLGWFGQLSAWADQQAIQLADNGYYGLAYAEQFASLLIQIGVAGSPLGVIDTITDPCKSGFEKTVVGALGVFGFAAAINEALGIEGPTALFYAPFKGWGWSRSAIGQAAWGLYWGVQLGGKFNDIRDILLQGYPLLKR